MRINLIAAMAKNRVIGIDNKMAWHLPADFAWFFAMAAIRLMRMSRR